ncbi:(3aS,4S,5R,7aS)-5-hydroxy-7a-methyl-1-oxo-octahydro-1H-indene-4-carboxyl-CoA dehydrogenase [Impatiens glandulifera]|uniref:(3aS,4S,5R, 7aS)-5-hydroxy-7a-methyl-1-oxo-octahydro-1H-indene-4- carboxyl-CoA dehydrogenase n=1 Tax=Impatiens glandulifera TaxID=253017 RepID=UPI001FB17E41|nr:(3aS,4S,5R,7aS)-5-hydroxy-7a-methyl-1-oxo-octahydro-1H-indene-4-carboxyl-CoA dehydrogenase [Impatiens glandulifera]
MGWKGILGFEYGIIQAPLGPDISGPELVAAVANAGGIGLLRAPDWESPDHLRKLIAQTRKLTDKGFGVGVILAFPHEENIRVILEEKVAVLQLYWGQCTQMLVDQAHRAGVKVVPQVGSVEEAKKAIDVGVDAIIVQGREAGGHVIGQEGLISLVPKVVDLVGERDIPVIAAGGIADSRGYVAALALGARGICLGTRFVATEESKAHPIYKRKLVELEETEYTDIFGRARWPGAPQRALRTEFMSEWISLPKEENETNQPIIGHSTIHGMEKDVRRFAGTVPNATASGEIESMAMYAGQGVGLIKEILPAAEVINCLVSGAQLLISTTF